MLTVTPPSSADVLPFEPTERERFVRLPESLLSSPAWQSLRPVPRSLYVEVAARYNGWNNGKIVYSVRDGKIALHVGQATVYRAFNVLQERGFLIPHLVICPNGKVIRQWELTDFGWDGEPPSRDFLNWGARKQ
jgi:hypothetical protein